jgi:hypothetical protein
MRLVLSAVLLLSSHGLGAVRFGTPKARAVASLEQTLGPPTSRTVNTGCGPRYTEVVWGGLSAEFRAGVFSGFRYRPGPGPRAATAKGITLGSSMTQLHAAYGRLRFVGTDRWGAAGLVFYDDGKPLHATRLRHIVEIKTGTCGDF